MKALVGAFNQEKALVGAFSVIVQPVVGPMERFTALILKVMLEMDGTDAKSKLGANAILGVSMAVCKAGAAHKGTNSIESLNT